MNRIKFLVCLFACASAAASPTEKVIGGESISEQFYPWHAYLHIKTDPEGICGGSLIADQWILTAAHCVKNAKPAQVSVSMGEVSRDKLTPRPIVDAIHIHPDYHNNFRYDIALLHLRERQQQEPITLAASENQWDRQEGSQLKVLGWGTQRENHLDFPEKLQIVAVPLLQKSAPTACAVQERTFDGKVQLCAGDLRGGRDSCGGDSGGALFRGGIDSTPVQYGLVSYGYGCGQVGRAGVYTRVAHFIPWIESIIGRGQVKTVNEPVSPLPPIIKREKGDRALLIGVDRYYLPKLNLRGPSRDTRAMAEFLQKEMGFAAEEIYILQGSQATRANIDKLVQEWLIEQSAPNGRVWLYFSGHGSYLPDDNGDEKEIDRQAGIAADETILPYDTDVLTFQQPENSVIPMPITANHIRDDEIDQWVKAMSGREVTLIFDSCHSGTVSRGFEHGKSGLLALNNHANKSPAFAPAVMDRTIYPLQKAQHKPLDLQRENVIAWSAVRSDQLAKDDVKGGIFTQYFLRGANGAADSNHDGYVTYGELLGYIKKNTLPNYSMEPILEIVPQQKMAYDIRTNKPLAHGQSPLDVFSSAQAMPNPHGLKVDLINADTGAKVDNPPYCAAASCPSYKIRVHTDREGLLLLYALGDYGKGQQIVPNASLSDDFSSRWRAGETRTIPLRMKISTQEPGIILAVLLDPAEQANYDLLDKRFSQLGEFDIFQLQQAIEQRDFVLLSPSEATEISFATFNILK